MDKITKALIKMTAKDREVFSLILEQINHDHKKVPGLIKLQGHPHLYRVRFGNYRAIFRITPDGIKEMFKLGKRTEKFYKNLD